MNLLILNWLLKHWMMVRLEMISNLGITMTVKRWSSFFISSSLAKIFLRLKPVPRPFSCDRRF